MPLSSGANSVVEFQEMFNTLQVKHTNAIKTFTLSQQQYMSLQQWLPFKLIWQTHKYEAVPMKTAQTPWHEKYNGWTDGKGTSYWQSQNGDQTTAMSCMFYQTNRNNVFLLVSVMALVCSVWFSAVFNGHAVNDESCTARFSAYSKYTKQRH